MYIFFKLFLKSPLDGSDKGKEVVWFYQELILGIYEAVGRLVGETVGSWLVWLHKSSGKPRWLQLLPWLPAQAGMVVAGQLRSLAEERDALPEAAATATWLTRSPGRRSTLRFQALLCGLFIIAVFLSTNLEQALMVTPDTSDRFLRLLF